MPKILSLWCLWGMLALRSSLRTTPPVFVRAAAGQRFQTVLRPTATSNRRLAFQFASVATSSRRRSTVLPLTMVPPRSSSSGTATKASTTRRATSSSTSKSKTTRPFHLLIVESPSKCDTIAKILEQYVSDADLPYDFRVTSCMGHVRNLPKRKEDYEQKASSAAAAETTSSKFPYAIRGIDLEDNYKPTYVLLPGKEAIVSELRSLASQADKVLLATDPDREGEAMAWHLTQVLALPHEKQEIDFERISFTEITPTAIVDAVSGANLSTGQVNPHLVAAQETRRVLDRLAGYTVSPILWRKIAPGLSAGRVQSVGLELIVQRERERLLFESTMYASIKGDFVAPDTQQADDHARVQVAATLHSINGTTVASSGKDFTSQGQQLRPESQHKVHLQAENAQELAAVLEQSETQWTVAEVESRERKQQPPQPYRTSTLQQDAVRRLGLSVQQTMRAAQQLYEKGLISYMRTDSTHLSNDAEAAVAQAITTEYGSDHVVAKTGETTSKRKKKKREDSKFAQEAHEAIRPAIQPDGGFLRPNQLTGMPEPVTQLYRLIHTRALACRMPPLVTNQTQVVIEGVNGATTVRFRASGNVVLSPGYTRAYGGRNEDENQLLPPLTPGQVLNSVDLTPQSHQSQPPPRYTEASFVKELEALGVGRPSTYAGTVQTLRDRAYVGSPSPKRASRGGGAGKIVSGPAISAMRAAGGEEFTSGGGGARAPMIPSLSAFVVCSLLEKYCPTYVDPGFTARMEERLDDIASGGEDEDDESWGEEQRVKYLDEFYAGDSGLAAQIKRIDDTVKAEEARRAALPALTTDSGVGEGEEVALFVGPWGPYVQLLSASDSSEEKPPTASLPAGMAADLSTITPAVLKALLSTKQEGGALIGVHPKDGRSIRLKAGRFGAYLQWGEDDEEGTTTHSLPRHKANMRDLTALEDGEDGICLSEMLGLTFEEAVGYVGLPRTVCIMNELPITTAIGPYGPYLKYNNSFVSLNEKDGDVLTVDPETAQRLVTDGIVNGKKKGGQGVVVELGEKDGGKVAVKNGRFGTYLNWKRVNAKLPTQYTNNPSEIPFEEAWTLIQEKAGAPPRKKKGTRGAAQDADLPPTPKRPLSAYLHFCAAKRPEVAETVKSLGEVSKKLAEIWAATPEEDRGKYHEMAAEGKAAYELEKQKWKVECDKVKKSAKKSTAKAVDNKKKRSTKNVASEEGASPPKRPLSAYLYFCAAHRAEVSERVQKLGDISKELARLWAGTEDRTDYERLAAKDKERYERDMKTYNGEANAGASGTSIAKTTRKKNGVKSKAKTTTSLRAPSAYMLFCKEFRPKMVDDIGGKLPFGETTKRLAKMWKESDDDTRNKFQQLAAEEKEKLGAAN